MGTEKLSKLPYIIIPTTKGKIKMLLDSGANVNVISKKWAYSSGQKIQTIVDKTVNGVTGTQKISEKIDLDLFHPFISNKFEFLILDFHPFFDGIIGTEIIFGNKFNLFSTWKTFQLLTDNKKICLYTITILHSLCYPKNINDQSAKIRI